MNLTVTRQLGTLNSTPGMLDIDGLFFCYTLEPRTDSSQGKPYAIPAGTYPISLEMSHKFGFVTPHVNNVPGFTAIEIHPGNFPKDTEGCCLVGESRATDFVGDSREAFHALMSAITLPASITYVDAVPVPDPELG